MKSLWESIKPYIHVILSGAKNLYRLDERLFTRNERSLRVT